MPIKIKDTLGKLLYTHEEDSLRFANLQGADLSCANWMDANWIGASLMGEISRI